MLPVGADSSRVSLSSIVQRSAAMFLTPSREKPSLWVDAITSLAPIPPNPTGMAPHADRNAAGFC